MNDEYGNYIPTPEDDRAHERRIALIYRQMPWRVESFANVIYPAYRWSGAMTGGYLFPEATTGGRTASLAPKTGLGRDWTKDSTPVPDRITQFNGEQDDSYDEVLPGLTIHDTDTDEPELVDGEDELEQEG